MNIDEDMWFRGWMVRIAQDCGLNARTVARVYDGERFPRRTVDRIARAARARGYELPPTVTQRPDHLRLVH